MKVKFYQRRTFKWFFLICIVVFNRVSVQFVLYWQQEANTHLDIWYLSYDLMDSSINIVLSSRPCLIRACFVRIFRNQISITETMNQPPPFQAPRPINWIQDRTAMDKTMDQFHQTQNAHVPHPTLLHTEQKCAHLCSEWSIVGYATGAFWELWIRLICIINRPFMS